MREPVTTNEIRFFDLTPADVPELFTLCPGCVYWELPEEFEKSPPRAETMRLKRQWIADHASGHVLGKVARRGGEAVGFIQVGPPDLYPQQLNYAAGPASPDALLVTCLFVKPAFRGRGLARRLLSLAEAAAREGGFAAIETFPRKESDNNPSGPIELYVKADFEILRDDVEFPLVRKLVQPSG
jgi:ribosomal protein S18 acetylase RimI-like enzyme